MKLRLTALAALLAIAGTAQADIKDNGWYIGGSLGSTSSSIKIKEEGEEDIKLDDDTDVLYGIYGGYKFMRHFALEGRLLALGKYKEKESGLSSETGVITINAVGLIPLGSSNWELMGQVGIGYSSNELKFEGEKEKEPLGTIGVGVRWTPAPAFTLQLAADYYSPKDAKEDGVTLESSITALALSGQFNF